jgi:hypothetical protein
LSLFPSPWFVLIVLSEERMCRLKDELERERGERVEREYV